MKMEDDPATAGYALRGLRLQGLTKGLTTIKGAARMGCGQVFGKARWREAPNPTTLSCGTESAELSQVRETAPQVFPIKLGATISNRCLSSDAPFQTPNRNWRSFDKLGMTAFLEAALRAVAFPRRSISVAPYFSGSGQFWISS